VIGHPFTTGNSTATAPFIDDNTLEILADATEILRIVRSGEIYNNADQLTAIASLAAQAHALIPDAVADAIDQRLHLETNRPLPRP
jgi:hypothetical protein